MKAREVRHRHACLWLMFRIIYGQDLNLHTSFMYYSILIIITDSITAVSENIFIAVGIDIFALASKRFSAVLTSNIFSILRTAIWFDFFLALYKYKTPPHDRRKCWSYSWSKAIGVLISFRWWWVGLIFTQKLNSVRWLHSSANINFAAFIKY